MKLRIEIEVIPHSKQRYPTLGDYFWDENGVLQVRVSDMNNQYFEGMVIVHELIEELLTRFKGIPEEEIQKFDIENLDSDDPGSLEDAPYHLEHMFALEVEKAMCEYMGFTWEEYDEINYN